MQHVKQIPELSNKQLCDELRSHGYNVGPVTADTRSAYEKKLQRHYTLSLEPGDNNSKSTATEISEPGSSRDLEEKIYSGDDDCDTSTGFVDEDEEYEQCMIDLVKKVKSCPLDFKILESSYTPKINSNLMTVCRKRVSPPRVNVKPNSNLRGFDRDSSDDNDCNSKRAARLRESYHQNSMYRQQQQQQQQYFFMCTSNFARHQQRDAGVVNDGEYRHCLNMNRYDMFIRNSSYFGLVIVFLFLVIYFMGQSNQTNPII
jgi:hypothetical protein